MRLIALRPQCLLGIASTWQLSLSCDSIDSAGTCTFSVSRSTTSGSYEINYAGAVVLTASLEAPSINITAVSLDMQGSSRLDASARGFAQLSGTGAGAEPSDGTGGGSGGGHGGTGGTGHGGNAGGVAYGVIEQPVTAGSGGGRGRYPSYLTYVPTVGTWAAGRAACQSLGGDLASIHSAAENDAVRAVVPHTTAAWIGATDAVSEGTWRWSDGTPWDYSNWSPGEPNNQGDEDCGEAYADHPGWNDMPCSAGRGAVCRLSAAAAVHFRDGGAGGGTVRIDVRGTLTLAPSASIRANGAQGADSGISCQSRCLDNAYNGGGGAAAGSIWITAESVLGNGSLQATGGAGGAAGARTGSWQSPGGGGAGGHIGMILLEPPSVSVFVSGGAGGSGAGGSGNGGAGLADVSPCTARRSSRAAFR